MAWTSRVDAARPPADPLVAQTRDLLSTAAANERPSTDSAIVSGRRCTRQPARRTVHVSWVGDVTVNVSRSLLYRRRLQ